MNNRDNHEPTFGAVDKRLMVVEWEVAEHTRALRVWRAVVAVQAATIAMLALAIIFMTW